MSEFFNLVSVGMLSAGTLLLLICLMALGQQGSEIKKLKKWIEMIERDLEHQDKIVQRATALANWIEINDFDSETPGSSRTLEWLASNFRTSLKDYAKVLKQDMGENTNETVE